MGRNIRHGIAYSADLITLHTLTTRNLDQLFFSDYFKGIDFRPGRIPFPLKAEWTSPSNIALVKYWGKKPGQLPANPSLSMTLDSSVTQTSVSAFPAGDKKGIISVNGLKDHPFILKLGKLISWMEKEVPVTSRFSFEVTTGSTFPHSTGIASSASGISAFSLCLLSILSKAYHIEIREKDFFRIASVISRMGSGSACRSVYGGYAVWGETEAVEGSSDLYSVPICERIHKDFKDLHDAILVVSSTPKILSSTAGHGLMDAHPFASARYLQARENLGSTLNALESGDMEMLALIAENEAMTLHALMMSSPGGSILLKSGSLEIIRKIRTERQKGLPVFFTIDAGPNIHLLYQDDSAENVRKFIDTELAQHCESRHVIYDRCGSGPGQINSD
jgi:diphosphomevalonate decarboxylase